jgi:hypothetical protein
MNAIGHADQLTPISNARKFGIVARYYNQVGICDRRNAPKGTMHLDIPARDAGTSCYRVKHDGSGRAIHNG